MSSIKLIARMVRTGSILLQVLLIAVLSVQGMIAGCLLVIGYIPLPADSFNQWLRGHIYQGYYIQGNSFQLSPNGSIQINDARLHVSEADNLVARAEQVQLRLSLRALSLKEFLIYRGTLFHPNEATSGGSPRAALSQVGLALERKLSGDIDIKAFTAQYDRLRIRGRAHFNMADFQAPRIPLATPTDPIAAVLDRLDKHNELKTLLKKTQNPSLFIHLEKDPTALSKLPAPSILAFYFDASSFEQEALAFEKIHVRTRASLEQTQLTLDDTIHFQADRIQLTDHGIQVEKATGQMEASEALGIASGKWPACQFHAQKVSGFGKTVQCVTSKFKHGAHASVQLDAYAYGFGGILGFAGNCDTRNLSGSGILQGNFNPALLLPEIDAYALPETAIGGAALCKTALTWDASFKNLRTQTFAHFIRPSLNGVSFEVASLNARYDSNQLEINPLRFNRGTQWLELTYTQSLNENRYSLSTEGQLIPKEYNPFMPRWWKNIFDERFTFTEQSQVIGDCVVYGKTSKFSTDFYYGQFETRNMAYQKVPIDRGHLTLRGRNRYTEIHRLNARSDAHWLKGDIRFTGYPDEIRASAAIRYDLEGVLPLEKLRQLLPAQTAEKLDAFETEHAPHLRLEAAQFREPDYPQFQGLSHLYLEVDASAPLTFHNIDLQHLRFKLHARDKRLLLRDLDFGLGGGVAMGAIDRFNLAIIEQPWLRLDLTLEEADYPTIQALLKDFKNTSALKTSRPIIPSTERGLLNLKLQSEGPAEDFYAHNGFGHFNLAHENLASIQLLGPLSMILEKTPLGFTSLKLNHMESDFALAEGFLKFSPLNITGPQAIIEANGTLQMSDRALDLIIGVNLIGNLNKKVNPFWRIADAINPLNYLMQFRVSGTLEEQSIRSLYDPRNLLPGGSD